MNNNNNIRNLITKSGLKATPQRIAIYEALLKINDHPTAEMIKDYLSKSYPTISLGTIYKTLDAFLKKNLIGKVQTEKDVTRYDVVRKKHHHLYCKKTNKIADYYDEELNEILNNYFQNQNIPGFKLEDIKLQIIGQFINK